jgi:hypothetical protein
MRCVLEVWFDDEDYYGARNHEAASKFFVQNLFGPDIGHKDRSRPRSSKSWPRMPKGITAV